jgi:hypothetical protein
LTITFESDSKLSSIESLAFISCSSLSSIWVSSSVEIIHEFCFAECEFLSTIIFEPGSKLFERDYDSRLN